ncbi:MAG: hypothetical protein PVI18_13600, partial [Desulfobacterales bacterium]
NFSSDNIPKVDGQQQMVPRTVDDQIADFSAMDGCQIAYLVDNAAQHPTAKQDVEMPVCRGQQSRPASSF